MTLKKIRVLIAGIGGASLGTEILKSLLLNEERYEVFGCDVSALAFGHYQHGFQKTFLIEHYNYIESIVEICINNHINCIVPGGEEPLKLLASSVNVLFQKGIYLASNSPSIIEKFTDKKTTFEILENLGFKVPLTLNFERPSDLDLMSYPCVVKPAKDSGGSSFVFLAENKQDALLYSTYLKNNEKSVIIQEYISESEGEFTIGVLCLPDQRLVGSIALKRIFNSKLSVLIKGKAGLISSGYTQGLIDDFPEIRSIAEQIAIAIESTGPINIQGRIKEGVLVPFEINPRFSASTYLRSLAGFNEIDLYLQYIVLGEEPVKPSIRYGYHLRSLSETWVTKEEIKQ